MQRADQAANRNLERILRSSPKWFCENVNAERESRGLDRIDVVGLPNDQGSPEQLRASRHASVLRQVERLQNEATRLKNN
jgi:hypothetical protein